MRRRKFGLEGGDQGTMTWARKHSGGMGTTGRRFM